MQAAIEIFEAGWAFIRGLTYDFIDAVPDDRWESSPHERYAPFHKQVRHLVCVQGVYNQGLRERRADFGTKHTHYAGSLDRASLVAALHAKDAETSELLGAIAAAGASDHVIDFYGEQPLAAYLNVYRTHEAIHHGQWSFYATLGGFETPPSWKLHWGL